MIFLSGIRSKQEIKLTKIRYLGSADCYIIGEYKLPRGQSVSVPDWVLTIMVARGCSFEFIDIEEPQEKEADLQCPIEDLGIPLRAREKCDKLSKETKTRCGDAI